MGDDDKPMEAFYCCLPPLPTSKSSNQSRCLLWLSNQTVLTGTAKEKLPWKRTRRGWCCHQTAVCLCSPVWLMSLPCKRREDKIRDTETGQSVIISLRNDLSHSPQRSHFFQYNKFPSILLLSSPVSAVIVSFFSFVQRNLSKATFHLSLLHLLYWFWLAFFLLCSPKLPHTYSNSYSMSCFPVCTMKAGHPSHIFLWSFKKLFHLFTSFPFLSSLFPLPSPICNSLHCLRKKVTVTDLKKKKF